MFKESVICIIIVVVIFSLDVFTQDYTNKTTLEITKIFSDLKEQILKEDAWPSVINQKNRESGKKPIRICSG